MSGIATMWIRDGVLVDRMHINPVAFAFAALSFALADTPTPAVEELIQFAFAKSGYSFAEKLQLYNHEVAKIVADVHAAARYYNQLATAAAQACQPFPGAVELLAELKSRGVHSFITSAVEQELMDMWSESSDGQPLTQQLDEVLGRRTDFSKGRDHFAYVHTKYKPERIYLIADAPAEIGMGRQFAEEFSIIAIGFGNVIDQAKVAQGYDIVRKSWLDLDVKGDALPSYQSIASSLRDNLRLDDLHLPDESQIVKNLTVAGADHVVSGSGSELMSELSRFFKHQLKPDS